MIRHAANSAAVFSPPHSHLEHGAAGNRGLWDLSARRAAMERPLRPVMKWIARCG